MKFLNKQIRNNVIFKGVNVEILMREAVKVSYKGIF